MRPLRRLLCTAALLAVLPAAVASPAAPQAGSEYLVLPTVQNTDAGKKVEVIEFFAYYCPHCNAFEPLLKEWVKKQGADIVYKRVHVPRDMNVRPQQRLFYTLEAMGLLDQYHDKVFEAMHQQRLRLNSDELVFDWAGKAGLDKARFVETYRSFGVQQRVRRADAIAAAYGINQWPILAIDGRYLTSPAHVGEPNPELRTELQQQQATLQVMDFLVAKAKADKK